MINADFSWNTQKYIDEVEHSKDPGLLEYERLELEYLTKRIKFLQDKTIIDVGAGYGRVLPHLAKLVNKFIAIERDSNLLTELHSRASKFGNCIVVEGDGTNLSKLLKDYDLGKIVIISTQNTLGPWRGSRDIVVDEMRRIAKRRRGEVVISLFNRESILSWGIQMYATATGLIGKYSPELSNLVMGKFKTDQGYESHWFSDEEVSEIKKRFGGKIMGSMNDPKFHLFHISYE